MVPPAAQGSGLSEYVKTASKGEEYHDTCAADVLASSSAPAPIELVQSTSAMAELDGLRNRLHLTGSLDKLRKFGPSFRRFRFDDRPSKAVIEGIFQLRLLCSDFVCRISTIGGHVRVGTFRS